MLGRTAFVLLANNSDSQDDWKGNDAMWHVAKKQRMWTNSSDTNLSKNLFRRGTPRLLMVKYRLLDLIQAG